MTRWRPGKVGIDRNLTEFRKEEALAKMCSVRVEHREITDTKQPESALGLEDPILLL